MEICIFTSKRKHNLHSTLAKLFQETKYTGSNTIIDLCAQSYNGKYYSYNATDFLFHTYVLFTALIFIKISYEYDNIYIKLVKIYNILG